MPPSHLAGRQSSPAGLGRRHTAGHCMMSPRCSCHLNRPTQPSNALGCWSGRCWGDVLRIRFKFKREKVCHHSPILRGLPETICVYKTTKHQCCVLLAAKIYLYINIAGRFFITIFSSRNHKVLSPEAQRKMFVTDDTCLTTVWNVIGKHGKKINLAYVHVM